MVALTIKRALTSAIFILASWRANGRDSVQVWSRREKACTLSLGKVSGRKTGSSTESSWRSWEEETRSTGKPDWNSDKKVKKWSSTAERDSCWWSTGCCKGNLINRYLILLVKLFCWVHFFYFSFNFTKKNAERRRQESIEDTKRECESKAAAEAARVGRIHKNRVEELNQR